MMLRLWRRFRTRDTLEPRREPTPGRALPDAVARGFKPAVDTDGRERRMRQTVEDNRLH